MGLLPLRTHFNVVHVLRGAKKVAPSGEIEIMPTLVGEAERKSTYWALNGRFHPFMAL